MSPEFHTPSYQEASRGPGWDPDQIMAKSPVSSVSSRANTKG
jgi:hypothetical protein